jgi:hypothetical protein
MSDGSPPSFVICSFVSSFLSAGCILGRVCGPNESRDQRSRQCAIRRRHSHFKLHQEVVYAHPSVGTWPMLSAGVACAPVPSRLAHVGHRRTGEAGEEAGLQGATSSSTRWPSPWAPRDFPMYAPGHTRRCCVAPTPLLAVDPDVESCKPCTATLRCCVRERHDRYRGRVCARMCMHHRAGNERRGSRGPHRHRRHHQCVHPP